MKKFNYWSRLFDFFDEYGTGFNSINAALSSGLTGYPTFMFYLNQTFIFKQNSTVSIGLNQWTHIAIRYFNLTGEIYLNGSSLGFETKSNKNYLNKTRAFNYIGRSSFVDVYANKDADVVLDDFKIFNRALTQQEIYFDMKNYL